METHLRAKILVIGMADSIHLARWLSQFSGDQMDFMVISSSPHRRVHPLLMQAVKSTGQRSSVSIPFFSKWLSLPMWILDRIFSDFFRGSLIAFFIRRHKPDLIHINELQNAGYATLRALKLLRFRNLPPIFTTNYGSELVWFGKFNRHRKKLVELLAISQGFSAECRRDYLLARELGFNGVELPLMPVAGGMRVQSIQERPRTSIAVKGYQNKWGRALTVLSVLQEIQAPLDGYKIEVFSSNKKVVKAVQKLRRQTSLDIVAYPKGSLSHSEMMDLFSRSLVYIGYSMSDGISTSMIEAMANGAIPVQTCTSCADEWIVDERTGFVMRPEDTSRLKSVLTSVLNGDFDTVSARAENNRVIQLKYDPDKLREIAREQYQKMLMFSK